MAGGTFLTQNKRRPGAYINLQSAAAAVGKVSDRGICAVPLALSFGPVQALTKVTATTDVHSLFGEDWNSTPLLPVREILKRAKTCLVYRLNGGQKATVTQNGLTVTAKYPGLAGNRMMVQVSAVADNSGRYNVNTYYDGELVANEIVTNLNRLTGNAFADFSGAGTPVACAGMKVIGGTDTAAKIADYTGFFNAMAREKFHTVAFPVTDSTILSAGCAFIRRMREEEGRKVQAVVACDTAPDYEGIINVKNGVMLADGTSISRELAVCYVAGATAGAAVNESLTYDTYDDAVAVTPKYTGTETEELLADGYFLFTERDGKAVCEQDINSLTSVTPKKSGRFCKNRVIRVLDNLADDLRGIFEEHYIGKISNDDIGRSLFRSECIQYLKKLTDLGAITNFKEDEDITVSAGEDGDSVMVSLALQPVDSLEKLYMTVVVS